MANKHCCTTNLCFVVNHNIPHIPHFPVLQKCRRPYLNLILLCSADIIYCVVALISILCNIQASFNPLSPVLLYRTKDSSDRDGLHPEHLAKRPCTISPSQRFSPSTGLPAHPPPNGIPTHPPNGLPHPPNPQMGPQHYRLEDMALAHQYRDAYRHNEHRDARDRHRPTGRTAGSD